MTTTATGRGRRALRAGLTVAATTMVVAAAPAAPASAAALVSPYFGAPFEVHKLRHAFAQAPSWTRDGKVLSGELDRAGVTQVYRANPDGSRQVCLTCGRVEGPSGFPQERPQGDWILFHSYGQQPVHTGAPGFGGYGGDLHVMRRDGSRPRRLTTTSDPDHGAPYTATSGVPYDNFHAFWSPDGRQVVWTHTEAHPLAAGGQTWQILLGDFVVRRGVPSLRQVRVVGKPYGVYETQPWAPDGSGFLFSAAGGSRSPYQASAPGWGHMQLYFLRLYGRGASPARPRVTQISDDTPAYNEQAIFTPDMRMVIMMSNRTAPQGSWYDLVVSAAMRTGFDAPDTGSTQTLQFLSDFVGADFHSDLYAVDIRTKAIRQLTDFPRGVVPEFFWNHDFTKLIWGLPTRGAGGPPPAYVGRFQGLAARQRRVPRTIPAPGLAGHPVDLARVGAQAQAVRDPGPTDDVSVPARRPRAPAAAFPHARRRVDRPTIPGVTGTYLRVWLRDLGRLSQQAGEAFVTPPLLAAVGDFG